MKCRRRPRLLASAILPALLGLLVKAATAAPPPPAREQARGLWVGPLHLCRGTVSRATIQTGIRQGDGLLITLTVDARSELARITAERLGQTLPIRHDGETILEPVVHVPMDLGVLYLSFMWHDAIPDTRRLQEAALGPC
jgi:hypothetical protein